ncbi:hypothetical protein B0H10DRAFT_427859 [Mycena sp. CBHHK59/15]|nr:hypothetical protein B0H10DRAFT_427859 [Mycena sp. CBHHK59/15]
MQSSSTIIPPPFQPIIHPAQDDSLYPRYSFLLLVIRLKVYFILHFMIYFTFPVHLPAADQPGILAYQLHIFFWSSLSGIVAVPRYKSLHRHFPASFLFTAHYFYLYSNQYILCVYTAPRNPTNCRPSTVRERHED